MRKHERKAEDRRESDQDERRKKNRRETSQYLQSVICDSL